MTGSGVAYGQGLGQALYGGVGFVNDDSGPVPLVELGL